MRILYVSDCHGHIKKYHMLLNIFKREKFDMIINGGDILPKSSPLIQNQENFISYFMNPFLNELFDLKIRYLYQFGNDDLKVFEDDVMNDGFFIINITNKKIQVGDFEFIGFNLVCDYPFSLKDYCRKDTPYSIVERQTREGVYSIRGRKNRVILKKIDWPTEFNSKPTLMEELIKLPVSNNAHKTIYIFHDSPAYIGLDECYGRRKVGSISVFKFIQSMNPLMTLHGHIHESPEVSGIWNNFIENTLCIQPGQSDLDDELIYVKIDINDDTNEINTTRYIERI